MGKPGVTEGIPKNCTGFPLFDPRGKKADELCAKFCAEHTCDEIEEIFNKAGIPCQRAYGPADIEKYCSTRLARTSSSGMTSASAR